MSLKKFLIIGQGELDSTDLVNFLLQNGFVENRTEQVLWRTQMDFYLHYNKTYKKISEWRPDIILYTSKLTADKVIKINEEIFTHPEITENKVVKSVAVGVYAHGLDNFKATEIFRKEDIDFVQCHTKKQEELLFFLKESREILFC